MSKKDGLRKLGFCVVLLLCAAQARADAQERECRAVAAAATAEMKAASTEPMSEQTLSAARDGAYRGCMGAALSQSKSATGSPNEPAPSASVASKSSSGSGGFFDFLDREPVRTDGHKRLMKRGH